MDGITLDRLRGRGLRPARRCPVPMTTHRIATGSSRHRPARSSWRRRWPPAATSWRRCSARASPGNQDGGHVDALPTYQPPRELGADARYPLALVCPKPHAFMNSQYGNMAKQLQQQGVQWCAITFRRRGVEGHRGRRHRARLQRPRRDPRHGQDHRRRRTGRRAVADGSLAGRGRRRLRRQRR